MKRLIIFIAIIISTVLVVDILFGVFSRYYVNNYQIPGDYRTIDYLMKETNDDVLIIGSSVALNSTISSVLEDSLNMKVWNGACNGQGLPYFETILEAVFSHHTPKVIIWGMREHELNYYTKGGRYNILAPYYGFGYERLDSYIEQGSYIDKLMAKSSLYRYNTIWVRILLYNFIEPGEKGEKGFIAKGIPPYFPYLIEEDGVAPIEEEGINMFKTIVDMCNERGTKLICFFPPVYKKYINTPSLAQKTIKQLCKENNVAVYDALQDSTFLNDSTLFYDNDHLNIEGAKIFTNELSCELKKILVDNKSN